MITYKYATQAWGWKNIMTAKTENFYMVALKEISCGCSKETLITQYVNQEDKIRSRIQPCCAAFKAKVLAALSKYVEEHGAYATGFD